MKNMLIVLATVVGALAASTASAADLSVQVSFTDKQRELIVSYAQKQSAPAPEQGGKGKKGKSKGLPPGIAKNLERGKPLPPGIAKQQLPQDLVVVLPPPPKGFEIVVADGNVVLVDARTQVVHDFIERVLQSH